MPQLLRVVVDELTEPWPHVRITLPDIEGIRHYSLMPGSWVTLSQDDEDVAVVEFRGWPHDEWMRR